MTVSRFIIFLMGFVVLTMQPHHVQAEEPLIDQVENDQINVEGDSVSTPHQFDILLGLASHPFAVGLNPGVFYDIPLLKNKGLLPGVKDSVYFEIGAYLATIFCCNRSYLFLTPAVGPRWSLHLTNLIDVFVAIKLGWSVGLDNHNTGSDLHINANLGGHYFFAENLGIRVEIGGQRHGWGLTAGLTVNLN